MLTPLGKAGIKQEESAKQSSMATCSLKDDGREIDSESASGSKKTPRSIALSTPVKREDLDFHGVELAHSFVSSTESLSMSDADSNDDESAIAAGDLTKRFTKILTQSPELERHPLSDGMGHVDSPLTSSHCSSKENLRNSQDARREAEIAGKPLWSATIVCMINMAAE